MSKGIVRNLKFKKHEGFDYSEFAKMLEESYMSTRKDGKNTKKKTFSPSTIGYGHGNCPRYWFIAFNGADFEDQFDAGAIANMMNGTYAHDRLEKIIEKTGVLKEKEREILSDDPPIRGFADVVLDWNDAEIIGEIKTTKEEQFVHRQSSMKPSSNHLLQILTYMKVSNASEGFLLYENKNTQEICVIPVNMNERNSQLIEKVFDWMRNVYQVYQDNTLPNRPFSKSAWACKGCPVKKVCWKEMGDGEVEVKELVVPK